MGAIRESDVERGEPISDISASVANDRYRQSVNRWILPSAHDGVAYIRALPQNGRMTFARSFLLDALQRVADGGDMDEDELNEAIPDPFALDKIELEAWEELSHRADDADIRARDGKYAGFKREWMRGHIAVLRTHCS